MLIQTNQIVKTVDKLPKISPMKTPLENNSNKNPDTTSTNTLLGT